MAVDVARYFYKGGLNCAESTLRCLIEEGSSPHLRRLCG